MAKKTFDNPDSHEREYTRLLLRYSKQLCTNINKVLIPHIGDLKSGFDADARVDGWLDNLQSLMAHLMHMATTSEGIVINRLHGLFAAISKFNDGQFRLVVRANTGLTPPEVVSGAPRSSVLGVSVFRSEPFLTPLADAWVSENVALIKSLPVRLHSEIDGIIRRGVINGSSVRDIKNQIRARYGVTEYRARLIAQDQTLKLNASLTRYRLQSVGVKRYIWRTVHDDRVRPKHAARNGNVYSWDKGPHDGLHPGMEVRCRCRAEAIWDDDDG